MPRIPLLLSCLLPLALAACGDEVPTPDPHGLEIETQDSNPEGTAISVAYAFEDKETWRADIYLDASQQASRGDGKAPMQKGSSQSTIELHQTYHAAERPYSESRLRFVRVASSQGDVDPPIGETIGRFEHAKSGRPRADTRKLSGQNIPTSETLYGSMMLAGLAGSGAWIPDRPIRKGESWPAEDVLTPRMVRILLQQGRATGVTMPGPRFHGTVRVAALKPDGAGGGTVELEIRSLIEVIGPMTSGSERGAIEMGYRVKGTAIVDLRTGLPLSLEATGEQQMVFESPSETIRQKTTLRLRLKAKRVDTK